MTVELTPALPDEEPRSITWYAVEGAPERLREVLTTTPWLRGSLRCQVVCDYRAPGCPLYVIWKRDDQGLLFAPLDVPNELAPSTVAVPARVGLLAKMRPGTRAKRSPPSINEPEAKDAQGGR